MVTLGLWYISMLFFVWDIFVDKLLFTQFRCIESSTESSMRVIIEKECDLLTSNCQL